MKLYGVNCYSERHSLCHQLQAKESQLHSSRTRIEELAREAQSAQRLAAEISSELDRSWKDLAQLEGMHRLVCMYHSVTTR